MTSVVYVGVVLATVVVVFAVVDVRRRVLLTYDMGFRMASY